MKRPALWTLAGIVLLFLFWEAASLAVGSGLILPGPLPVLRRFLGLLFTGVFLRSLVKTFFRVLLGISVSMPLGMAAGLAAGKSRAAEALLKPLFQVISATPVMSVILIVFLWFGQERTPVFTAFLMVFPVMAANTLEGVRNIDPKFEELFRVYGLSRTARLRDLYVPGIAPFVLAGLRSSLSLCWKVVVAAEVLVQPLRALGTGMQNARARLETAELFAWTAGTVCAAALSQGLLSLALRISGRRKR